ncbi:hypothetical protein B0J11DRAFT_155223 [Dendryphion nanum]|uniref:Uncharacterized protein n=1 Tax=Dendryphion nanum TaxID=256645 RepID=A0A9P9EDM9_9PLEO|nr:hypothetical protein B0J11DRAFT_155223 [Dendryphion nanum]
MSGATQYSQPWWSYWNDFKTNWTYPPAADPGFVKKQFTQPVLTANATSDTSTALLISAVQTLPRPEDGKFGAETSVVHIGDVIEADWVKIDHTRSKSEPRKVELRCVICQEGKQGGTIYNACGNYTQNDVISFRTQTADIPAHDPVSFDRLHHVVSLNSTAVGLCYLTLGDVDGVSSTYDVTTPFPVIASTRTPHWRFSTTNPAGTADSTIGQPVTAIPTPWATAPPNTKDKPSVGIIAGVVIAVFVFTCLVVAIIWFVWTRTRRTRVIKRVDTPGTEEGVELQRVQRGGVERRTDRDEDGEAPPAYHESLKHQVVTEHEHETQHPPQLQSRYG